jgi:hypothetical protein
MFYFASPEALVPPPKVVTVMNQTVPFRAFSPFATTTFIVPRAGARPLRVEKAKPRAVLLKTGAFGLCAEPRPVAPEITLRLAPPPAPASLYVQTARGLVRSEAFEDWLEQAARRIAAQRPGRVAAGYALVVTAPRTARTRQFGALERPLVELLARCRVIRRGLSPDKFCVSYGGTGGDLTLTLSDFIES